MDAGIEDAELQYLVERGLLAPHGVEGEVELYSVTQEGLASVYLLTMVMAANRGDHLPPEMVQIADSAAQLLKAMDQMQIEVEREEDV